MKLVNTLVVHENAMPLGSSAVMNCVINNLPLKMEISGQTSYGLSHRGLGDNTDALCTLFETCNPAMGSYHDKVTEELVKDGISGNYLAMHRAGLFPNSYDFDESGWPIEKRTASPHEHECGDHQHLRPDVPRQAPEDLRPARCQRNDRQRPGGHPEVPGLRDSTGKVLSPGGPGSSIELK